MRAMVDQIGIQEPPKYIRAELRELGVVFDGEGMLKKMVNSYVRNRRLHARLEEMPTSMRGRHVSLRRSIVSQVMPSMYG